MRKLWVTIGLIVTVFLVVGFVGTYWMGDFLFQSLLEMDQVVQLEQMIQSPTATLEPVSKSNEEIDSEKTGVDSFVSDVKTQDKLSIAVLVTRNLTGKDITTLFQMVLDGKLTTEEKQAAIDLCYQRFSPEEVEKVRSFYEKYKGNISIVP